MGMIGFGRTDKGLQRDNNEDSFLIDNELGLYIVADGMGGHLGGEVASRRGVEIVAQHIQSNSEVLKQVEKGTLFPDVLLGLVEEAIQNASSSIYRTATATRELRGMGTTMTVLLHAGSWAAMGHVGDSRLYLCRGGGAYQLSLDHCLGNELVRVGVFTEEQAKHHASSHVLTRAVGTQPGAEVDVSLIKVVHGDSFLLCSDGLSNHFQDQAHVANFVKEEEDCEGDMVEHEMLKKMIFYALECGGQDNITGVLVKAFEPFGCVAPWDAHAASGYAP